MRWFYLLLLTISTFADDWQQYKASKLASLDTIPGWCSLEKAEKIMDLIYATRPTLCVEIGVFAGRSLYPTAEALKYLKDGIVFAIDPWSNKECVKGYTSSDPNYLWWDKIDLESQFIYFSNLLQKHKLTEFCYTLRLPSKDAVNFFTDDSIDILHLDGNHSKEAMLQDVQLFLPKVKKGGYIWLNDADWPSAIDALIYISDAEWDPDKSIKNSCYLFKKR